MGNSAASAAAPDSADTLEQKYQAAMDSALENRPLAYIEQQFGSNCSDQDREALRSMWSAVTCKRPGFLDGNPAAMLCTQRSIDCAPSTVCFCVDPNSAEITTSAANITLRCLQR
jgi:hypothetical protein